jgi:hypothetical protein
MHTNAIYLVLNDVDWNLIFIKKMMLKRLRLMKVYDHLQLLNFIMIHLPGDIQFLEFHNDLRSLIMFQLNYKVRAQSCFKEVQSGNFSRIQLLNLNILLNQSFLLLFILKHQQHLFSLS